MKFLLPQDAEVLENLCETISKIYIRGIVDEYYGSYRRVPLKLSAVNSKTLEYLQNQGTMDIKEYSDNDTVDFFIFNHYRVEALFLEVVMTVERKKNPEAKTYKRLGTAVVYDPDKGVGFINGNPVDFRRKQSKQNKLLFDALFLAGKEGVERKKLKRIVASTDEDGSYVAYSISAAFTKLRKICGVDASVIQLNDSGKLNVQKFCKPDGRLSQRLSRSNMPNFIFSTSVK